jgi:hypothetical protein
MLPDALMMTSWPGCGIVLVFQLLAVFHDPLLGPIQLTVLNSSRLSNASKKHPARRRNARRGFFFPPVFKRGEPVVMPNTNGICLRHWIIDAASRNGNDHSYVFYRINPRIARKIREEVVALF